jgi:hypothetical protein
MAPLRNPKHEAFAQAAAVPGVKLVDAYAAAGYVPRRGNPGRLARHSQVAARIAELRADVDPADLANLERIHEKMLEVAWRVRAAAGNRDAAARCGNDARQLAAALDREAGNSRWSADLVDHVARVGKRFAGVDKWSASRANEERQRAAALDRGADDLRGLAESLDLHAGLDADLVQRMTAPGKIAAKALRGLTGSGTREPASDNSNDEGGVS